MYENKNIKIFGNGNVPNQSEEVLVIKNLKCNVPWTYTISDLDDEEIIGTFYEK